MKFIRREFLKRSFLGALGFLSLGGMIMDLLRKETLKGKKVKFSFTVDERHWVGDGFYVHGLLRPKEELHQYISPFILMDYASPMEFSKTNKRRGVGEHPHRGFETVTLAYQGEVEHRDSSGGGGVIKPGGVQWMTAGKGVVHDEFHSEEFSKRGGIFEMVQLWVNLPKKDKMTAPKYQGIKSEEIPNIDIGKSSKVRVIAGHLKGINGPASTFSPINMYDLIGEKEDQYSMKIEQGTNTVLLILKGSLAYQGQNYDEQSILIFDREGEEINLKTSENFKGLILNGAPIDEPIVAHGPFVMNSKEEIVQAIEDFNKGKMGNL